MEDIILIEYLRKKGILDEREYSELKLDMLSVNKVHKHTGYYSEPIKPTNEGIVMTSTEFTTNHFNESYAKYLVSKMWHLDKIGTKYVGEKFSLHMAKEVCERYRGLIPQHTTHADVYVAINNQYHNYHCLFKSWFGDDVDNQIVESAIVDWFKDDDYEGTVKIWEYFKED